MPPKKSIAARTSKATNEHVNGKDDHVNGKDDHVNGKDADASVSKETEEEDMPGKKVMPEKKAIPEKKTITEKKNIFTEKLVEGKRKRCIPVGQEKLNEW